MFITFSRQGISSYKASFVSTAYSVILNQENSPDRRNRPLVILDADGRIVATVLPPPENQAAIKAIGKHIRAMATVASRQASPDRGGFKTITYGTQKGGSSAVCPSQRQR